MYAIRSIFRDDTIQYNLRNMWKLSLLFAGDGICADLTLLLAHHLLGHKTYLIYVSASTEIGFMVIHLQMKELCHIGDV